MTRDDLIKEIQKNGLKAVEAMEVVTKVDKYIEANTTQYTSKGALALANLVEKMREAQFQGLANRKQLEVKVDNAIKRIKEITDEV